MHGEETICNLHWSSLQKIPESNYTFVYFGSVNTFLLQSLGNSEIADEIVTNISTLTNLLSQPKCALIKPINIDYNYIEVQPKGTCFDIWNKCFIKDPAELKGSPRAFVKHQIYQEGRIPKPKLFVEGM